MVGETDFDALLPNIDPREEDEPWMPVHCDSVQIEHAPVPGRIMCCFRASASLCEPCLCQATNLALMLVH